MGLEIANEGWGWYFDGSGDHWGTSTIVSRVLALNQAFRKKTLIYLTSKRQNALFIWCSFINITPPLNTVDPEATKRYQRGRGKYDRKVHSFKQYLLKAEIGDKYLTLRIQSMRLTSATSDLATTLTATEFQTIMTSIGKERAARTELLTRKHQSKLENAKVRARVLPTPSHPNPTPPTAPTLTTASPNTPLQSLFSALGEGGTFLTTILPLSSDNLTISSQPSTSQCNSTNLAMCSSLTLYCPTAGNVWRWDITTQLSSSPSSSHLSIPIWVTMYNNSWWENPNQEPTETSKQPISSCFLGHVTSY
eukprot:sb/3467169/